MRQVWMCRARQAGKPFPSLARTFAGLELLNWQANSTVLVQGPAPLMAAWALAHDYTLPKVALPGAYLVDADTLLYVNARGQLVPSAGEVLGSLHPATGLSPRPTEAEARAALAQHHRVFVLSDLNSFQVKLMLLELFGIRDRPREDVRWR